MIRMRGTNQNAADWLLVLLAAWCVSCRGPICDSVGCIVAETVTVTGIPTDGHSWLVTVCAGGYPCESGTIDVYQSVTLTEVGDASATQDGESATATTTRPTASKIDLTVSLTGGVVTEGRQVRVTVKDASGTELKAVDHTVHLASTNVGGEDCPVMCPESRTTASVP